MIRIIHLVHPFKYVKNAWYFILNMTHLSHAGLELHGLGLASLQFSLASIWQRLLCPTSTTFQCTVILKTFQNPLRPGEPWTRFRSRWSAQYLLLNTPIILPGFCHIPGCWLWDFFQPQCTKEMPVRGDYWTPHWCISCIYGVYGS